MKKLAILFVLATLFSCKSADVEIVKLEIRPANAVNYFLDDIASEIIVLPLIGDSVMMGDISYIKSYGDVLILDDNNHGRIHLFDTLGNHMSTLDRRGRGPREYLGFGTFSYNKRDSILSIFSRSDRSFVSYNVSGMNFLSKEVEDVYFNSMEYLDGDNILRISEGARAGKSGSVELYNSKTKSSLPIEVDSSYLSMELSVDQTLTNTGQGAILYCQPGPSNIVYKITYSSVDTLLSIDFGNKAIPEKYWKTKDDNLDLGEVMANSSCAIMPHYFIDNELSTAVWYMTSPSMSGGDELGLQLDWTNKISKENYSVSNLLIKGLKKPIKPAGILGNKYYITVLHSGDIDTQSETQTKLISEIRSKIDQVKDKSEVVLLIYKL